MLRTTTLSLVGALALAHVAGADTLWDQSDVAGPFGGGGPAIGYDETPDGIGGNPGFTGFEQVFAVSDVTVGGGGWNIESVTTYHRFAGGGPGTTLPGNPTTAYLHIFSDNGSGTPTASDDPLTSSIVTITTPATGGVGPNNAVAHVVTAAGLDIDLAPGDYWIGLTPIWEDSTNVAQQSSAGVVGDPSAVFLTQNNSVNPNGFFAPGSLGQWLPLETGDTAPRNPADLAILIEGTVVPEPTSLALLGLGGLALLRRRR